MVLTDRYLCIRVCVNVSYLTFQKKTYFASDIDWLVEARTVRAVKEMDPTLKLLKDTFAFNCNNSLVFVERNLAY